MSLPRRSPEATDPSLTAFGGVHLMFIITVPLRSSPVSPYVHPVSASHLGASVCPTYKYQVNPCKMLPCTHHPLTQRHGVTPLPISEVPEVHIPGVPQAGDQSVPTSQEFLILNLCCSHKYPRYFLPSSHCSLHIPFPEKSSLSHSCKLILDLEAIFKNLL